MNDKRWMKWVGIGCGVVALLGCMGGVSCLACSMMARQMETTVAAPGGETCARAVACCEAAVVGLGPVEAGNCDLLAGQVDLMCEVSTGGYAATFEQHGLPVPPACQPVERPEGFDDL